VFFAGLPNEAERRGILRIHLARRGRDPERFNIEALAAASEGYSGAEIEAAVIGGLHRAFADQSRELTDADILGALAESPPLSQARSSELADLRRWAAENARAA